MKSHRFSKDIRQKLTLLTNSNNYRGVLALAEDYAIILISVKLSLWNWCLYPLSVLIIGSRQRALATLLHDSAHGCLSRSPWLNKLLGKYFSGFLILQEFEAYQYSHVLNHHSNLGTELDPDYQYFLLSGLNLKSCRSVYIKQHLVKPLLLSKTFSYVAYLFQNRLMNISRYPKQATEMFLFWIVFLIGIYNSGTFIYFVLFWVIPFLTSFVAISWFIETAEHCPLIFHADYELEATWNRFSHPVESLLTGIHQESYHLTHHLRSDIPFWNIKKAHEIMMTDHEYRKVNEKMGGIFLSGNSNKSIWYRLIETQTQDSSIHSRQNIQLSE